MCAFDVDFSLGLECTIAYTVVWPKYLKVSTALKKKEKKKKKSLS